jgi:hypothetical protein
MKRFIRIGVLSLATAILFSGGLVHAASQKRVSNPADHTRLVAAAFPKMLLAATGAQACKDSGGVPVSSAFGVTNNCVGSDDKNPIIALLSTLVRFATGLFGLILVAMVSYAGIRYTISAGSPDDVKEAKNHLKAAVTGLVVFALMSGILQFILPPQFRIFG